MDLLYIIQGQVFRKINLIQLNIKTARFIFKGYIFPIMGSGF